MGGVGFDHYHIVLGSLVADHAVHSQQTSRLLDGKAALLIGLDVEMADAGVFFVEKELLFCDRRLGGVHGMHLCTSANHSHWTSPFAFLPGQKCLDKYKMHLGARLTFTYRFR